VILKKFDGREDEFDGAEVPGLIEGDILLAPNQQRSSGNFLNNKWPNNQIVWEWGSSYSTSEKNVILGAMQLITDKTDNCITFRQRQSGDTDQTYISIIRGNGCYSYLGRVKTGAQPLSLGNGCVYTGTAVHEFMHALGYNHEHTRNDRDNTITVYYENIRSGYESQFDKRNADYYGTSYDILSIMHYGSTAFSKNGLPTIVAKDPSVGTLYSSYAKSYEEILTSADVQGVKTRYNCPLAPTTAAPSTTAAPTTTKRRRGKGSKSKGK